jgi:tRNA(Ile)-lysidine synthase
MSLNSIDAAVRRFFAEAGIEPSSRMVVAVSGGADSTALLLALSDLRFELLAAHVNHHLRGDDSDADEAFVRALCRELGVVLHVADGALDPDSIRARGIEAAARAVRYERLSRIRLDTGARFVATAHQKNDQAETVLMRLLTGAGVAGLRGIHPIRDDGVIRPLLEVTRAEIDACLRERNITPRHDRSNDDRRFLRNRVRAVLRTLDATDALANVTRTARDQWSILEHAVDEAERESVEITNDETRFNAWPENAWLRGALLQRHIRRLDDTARDFDAHRIVNELDSIRRLSVTKSLELIRRDSALVLRKRPTATPEFEIHLSPNNPAFIPELAKTVHLAGRPGQPTTDHHRQHFQLPQTATPHFTIRNRRNGDRFQPLGLPSPKKLKDFLIDRKIPVEIRDRLPLLIWNGEIVWVAGVEISERFKITDSAGGIYEVWMEDSGAADHDDHSRLQR